MDSYDVTLVPLRTVLSRTGDCRSEHYRQVRAGLMPPPIADSWRRVTRYAEHEVNTVLAARFAGVNQEQLRVLVRRLVATRSKLLPTAIAQPGGGNE